MKVLVTGSSGFVGAAQLHALPDYIPFDLLLGDDLRDAESIRRKAAGCQRILHLAAVARFSDADANPHATHEINVVGTRNVALVADELRIPVVFGSTGSVYMPLAKEPPITENFPALGNSIYGCSKRFAELYIEAMRAPWIILRYAHLYGPGKKLHGLIGGFVDKIESGLRPVLFGGAQTNDFTYISDIVTANTAALNAPSYAWNQTYNIGTGTELSAHAAGKMVCEAWGYEGEPEIHSQRGVDPSRFVYNISKAKRLLGWSPEVDFATGLRLLREASK